MAYTEWDPLQEVVVGSAYSTSFLKDFKDQEFVEGVSRILEETEEDFQMLAQIFSGHNIKVHRAPQYDLKSQSGVGWESQYPYPPICPRDFNFVWGNFILNTVGGDCNRINESEFFNPLLYKYKAKQDINFISMPRPNLSNEYLPYQDLEPQALYHSANILKCGDALLHTRPYDDSGNGRGTKAGLQWIKDMLPKHLKWIEIPAVGHADGKLALLRPGLLMCWDEKHIPQELKHWDRIVVPTNKKDEQLEQLQFSPFYKQGVKDWLNHWIGCVDETCFDINVISIDPNTVITNGYNVEVERKLRDKGITMIPFNFRHKYFWDSGLHCVTLDLYREGQEQSYV